MLLYSINKEYIALKNHFARLEKCKASFSGKVSWNSGDLTNLHLIKPVAVWPAGIILKQTGRN